MVEEVSVWSGEVGMDCGMEEKCGGCGWGGVFTMLDQMLL